MAGLIPDDPDTLLTRVGCAAALTAAGFPTSPKTLATKASRGGGPPFRRWGGLPRRYIRPVSLMRRCCKNGLHRHNASARPRRAKPNRPGDTCHHGSAPLRGRARPRPIGISLNRDSVLTPHPPGYSES